VGFEAGTRHATPGKRFFGLTVTDTRGTPVSVVRAFLRNLFRLLPWSAVIVAVALAWLAIDPEHPETQAKVLGIASICWLAFPVLGLLDYLWIALSRRKQALHDVFSGCLVVRENPLSTGAVFGRILCVFAFWIVVMIASALLGAEITFTSSP
jgi:uncharacterized RDD family membrane protein YckC